MKRRDLLRHLADHGCRLEREGARHSVWANPVTRQSAAVPRHREILEPLVRAICQALGVPAP